MADAPTVPGSYLGQFQNGYYWNGTSWDQGETTPSSAVPPSTMSLNSGPQATPTPTAPGTSAEELFKRQAVAASSNSTVPTVPAPATPTTTAPSVASTTTAPPSTSAPAPSTSKPSILSTIMRVESGGRNVPQSLGTADINNNYGKGGGDPAQGYYQITGGTWRDFGGDKTGHKSALDAPYATQLQIAQNIPVERWGPATQQALKNAGYEAKPGETLGQMLTRYGEDPTATRPEDVGGSSGGGTATAQSAPFVPPAGLATGGLLAQSSAGAQQATADAAAATKQKKTSDDLIKEGQGLLGQAETQAPALNIPPPAGHRPQAQVVGMPDFMQILAQQRLTQGT